MRFALLALTTLIATQAHARSVIAQSPTARIPDSVRVSLPIERQAPDILVVDDSGAKPAPAPAPAPAPQPIALNDVEIPKKFQACAKLKSSIENTRSTAEAKLNNAARKGNEANRQYYSCRSAAAYEALSNAEQLVCTGSMSVTEAKLQLLDSLQACNVKAGTAKADPAKPVVVVEAPQAPPIILVTPDTQARTPASSLKSGSAQALK